MPFCLIGLGANFGDRQATLSAAVARLRQQPAVQVVATSPWFETAPVGGPAGQAAYLNGALLVETALPPHSVLELLQQVECDLGRRRQERWGPRSIDLDLLLYDQLVLLSPTLVLPHPRMAWRRFVLRPAACIASEMVHPTIGWTISQLLEHLDAATPYIAITGPVGAGKTELAERLARHVAARLIHDPLDTALLEAFHADPASRAWPIELQFLRQRSELLRAGAPPWKDRSRLVVSDFWFRQSLAYARSRLATEQWEAFYDHWERADREVVQPKLIVVLDVPAVELRQRVFSRGRPFEGNIKVEQLERIRQAILDEAARPGMGPVLHLSNLTADAAFAELLAAVQAME
jgi:2-amino-4-hydroxy-6-hydroxymethyldihydropteridine diphosphokinase